MKAWDAAGFPLERIGQMSVHELNERKASLQIVDVRSPGEWKKGHVPGAQHIFVPELPSEWVNSIATNRRRFTAAAAIARASLPAF